MTKELEYIRDISCLLSENYSDKEPLTEEQKLSKNCFLDYCKYIETALKRLEAIDNAKPSEALVSLEFICRILNEKGIDIKWVFKNDYNTIKQALIKAQEQEKVLKVIKEKVLTLVSIEDGCVWDNELYQHNKLTEEEFDTLKRWIGNGNQ